MATGLGYQHVYLRFKTENFNVGFQDDRLAFELSLKWLF